MKTVQPGSPGAQGNSLSDEAIGQSSVGMGKRVEGGNSWELGCRKNGNSHMCHSNTSSLQQNRYQPSVYDGW